MAKKTQTKKQAAYIRRLAENDYVQKQLGDAATALSKVYRRAAKGRGEAVEDKKLYTHLREAATSIRKAVGALRRGKPAPAPKRRGRKLIVIAAAGGGALLLASRWGRRKRSSEEGASSSNGNAAAAGGDPDAAPAAAESD